MANGKYQKDAQTQEDQRSTSSNCKNAWPGSTGPRYRNLIFGRNETYEGLLVGPPKQKIGESLDEKKYPKEMHIALNMCASGLPNAW